MDYNKNMKYVLTHYDEVIELGRCILWEILIVGDGTNATTLTLKDGFDSGGKTIFPFQVEAAICRPIKFEGGLTFQTGLFADWGANPGYALIGVEKMRFESETV